MTTERTLTRAELERLARALHRGDELHADERELYRRCDADPTGSTGGDLIELLDQLEANATPCRWCGGILAPTDRDDVHDLCRMTADDCDDASADELEAAAEILDNARRTEGGAEHRGGAW